MISAHCKMLLCAGLTLYLSTPGIGEEPTSKSTSPCSGSERVPVAWYARPSVTPAYTGYYVGGGCLWRGEPRNLNEGTWGWDYEGKLLNRYIWLNWCHGRRCQGGTGSYRTDGPPLPSLAPFLPHFHDH
jgi:hypothetical protein